MQKILRVPEFNSSALNSFKSITVGSKSLFKASYYKIVQNFEAVPVWDPKYKFILPYVISFFFSTLVSF